MLIPAESYATRIRQYEELEANLTWFRSPERGPAFARGFLYGCSSVRKFLHYCGKEDPELKAANIVAKESNI